MPKDPPKIGPEMMVQLQRVSNLSEPLARSVGEDIARKHDERHQYHVFLQDVRAILTHLDFMDLAEQAGLKRRRAWEVMHFRMGTGEVHQLSGLQNNVCYICNETMEQSYTAEPFCLVCLGAMQRVIEPMVNTLAEAGELDSPADTVVAERVICRVCHSQGQGSSWVCIDCYRRQESTLTPLIPDAHSALDLPELEHGVSCADACDDEHDAGDVAAFLLPDDQSQFDPRTLKRYGLIRKW